MVIAIQMELKVFNCRFIVPEEHYDNRGKLLVFEGLRSVPFEIKRVYTVSNVARDAVRGMHAHIRLRQLIVCLTGSCKLLLDDGVCRQVVTLETSRVGLYIGEYIWREMFDFSWDCILMVLASELYDAGDYIHNYKKFLEIIKR